MSRERVLLVALALSLSMNLAGVGAVLARQSHGSGHGCAAEAPLSLVHDEVELTPAQHQAFDRLGAEFQAFRRTHQQAVLGLRKQLSAELLADQPDQARITTLLESIRAEQSAVMRKLVDQVLEQKALLQPEQRDAFRRAVGERLGGPGNPHL